MENSSASHKGLVHSLHYVKYDNVFFRKNANKYKTDAAFEVVKSMNLKVKNVINLKKKFSEIKCAIYYVF